MSKTYDVNGQPETLNGDGEIVPNQPVFEVKSVIIHAIQMDAEISEHMRRFFKENALPSFVPHRYMSYRTARFWMGIINFVIRRMPYRFIAPLEFWLDGLGQRSGLWDALRRVPEKMQSNPGGGFVLPHDVAKVLFRQGNFMVYWRMEGEDLAEIKHRLEKNRWAN